MLFVSKLRCWLSLCECKVTFSFHSDQETIEVFAICPRTLAAWRQSSHLLVAFGTFKMKCKRLMAFVKKIQKLTLKSKMKFYRFFLFPFHFIFLPLQSIRKLNNQLTNLYWISIVTNMLLRMRENIVMSMVLLSGMRREEVC